MGKNNDLSYDEKMERLLKRQEKGTSYLWNALKCAVAVVVIILISLVPALMNIFYLANIFYIVGGIFGAAAVILTVMGICNLSSKKIKMLSGEIVRMVLEEKFDICDYKPLKHIDDNYLADFMKLYPGGVKHAFLPEGCDLIKAEYKGKAFVYSSLTLQDSDGAAATVFRGQAIATSINKSFNKKIIIQTSNTERKFDFKQVNVFDSYFYNQYLVFSDDLTQAEVGDPRGFADKIIKLRAYVKCPFSLFIAPKSGECVLILETAANWFGGNGESTMDATRSNAEKSADFIAGILDIINA